MGLLALNRLLSLRREPRRQRRRRQIRARNGSSASLANGKRVSNHQRNDGPQSEKIMTCSGPDLPEDIWRHIHSKISLRDAARSACVSHAFLHYWRSRPNITFSCTTLGITENVHKKNEIPRDFNSKVDNILKKHSVIGLRNLEIKFYAYNADTSCYLDSWLDISVTPELEGLTLSWPLYLDNGHYIFPCSLLSNGSGNSIRRLHLTSCAFSSTVGLDCLKNLSDLRLFEVGITEELGCLLSGSIVLEQLELSYCNEIICLKIPSILQRLSCLMVWNHGELSIGKSLQMKYILVSARCAISYACAKLPSIVPNLETLSLASFYEVVNAAMVTRPFLHLKHLAITLSDEVFYAYDCFSLVTFLDSAPSLESFALRVSQTKMYQASIAGDPSPLRQMAGHRHNNLKSVHIFGFCSAKSLVELACYILENATSLDCLTLDTTLGCFLRCSANKVGKCFSLSGDMIKESRRALWAIEAYIKGKVPPTVKLNVLGHCNVCHGP
ncbi:hypothetical protein ACP4OV_014019 [Aristida adscensionis]